MKKSFILFFGYIICFYTSTHAQNIGVGEAVPSTKFEIKGNTGIDLFNVKDQANDSKLYIQNDGDVGIGTTTPSYKLHVAGNVLVDNGGWLRVTGDQGIYFQDYGGGWRMQDATWIRTYGGKSIYQNTGTLRTDGTFQVGGSGSTLNVPEGGNFAYRSDVLFANTSGNVGIGTASPSEKLDVNGTVRVAGKIINVTDPTGPQDAATKAYVDAQVGSVTETDPTWSGSANTTASVGRTGNVGVGIASPSHKLHVNGNVVVEDGNYITTTADDIRFLGGTTSDDNTYEWAGFYSGTTRQGIILYDGAWSGANNITNELSITAENSNKLTLNTSGEDIALMPDGSGNVGVNTISPVSELEIEGGAQNWNTTTPGKTVGSIHLDPGSSSANIGNAITFGAHDTGGGDNAQAGIYVKSDGGYGTRMYLATTNSYATGAKTTMMLNHDGNVGIGTVSPSAKLHINGTTLSENHVSLSSGNGKGFRFWNSNSYKIHMGNASEYQYGPVSDYSIKTNMSNTSTRGWTWGVSGSTPVMAVSATEGHMALKGALFLDCASCGSGSSAYPNGGSSWGDMVIQGRVMSTNSNLHLSPPGGMNVIINDSYRAAGGASTSSEAGLIVYGDAAINTTSLNGSYQFYVNGRIGSNGINETSDKRFKKDIQPLENSLSKLIQLQGVSYHWRQDEFPDREFKAGKDMGVIAQDVEKIFPEAVETDGDGYKSVQYSSLVPVLIEAVKEQKTIIEQLKNNHEQELNCLNQKIENYEELFEGIDLEAFKQAFAKEKYTARK